MEKTLLAYLVAMHDQLLTTKWREARHVYEERLRTLRRRVRPSVATLIATGESLLHPERPPETTLADGGAETPATSATPTRAAPCASRPVSWLPPIFRAKKLVGSISADAIPGGTRR